MIPDYQITDDTPIIMLTVGQLKGLIKAWTKDVSSSLEEPTLSTDNYKRYVYGISGIASLFQVSHATAIK